MENSKKYRLYFIFISLIIVIADQFTKYIIDLYQDSLINTDLIFISLDYVKNYGAAFNLFSGSRVFLSIVSVIISIILLFILLGKKNTYTLDLYSYTFILGGTIGNGIDRIAKGYVIDFINLNIINFPVFNIADISINIGFILIIYSFIKYKK